MSSRALCRKQHGQVLKIEVLDLRAMVILLARRAKTRLAVAYDTLVVLIFGYGY